jgi:SsrA-binding protein
MARQKRKKTRPGDGGGTVVTNRKARHQYTILETVEAGIELRGSEVKSLRAGQASLAGAYARPRGNDLYLVDAQINQYPNAHERIDPTRPRRLLLHRRQIDKLTARTQQKGYTVVPLRLYFKDGWAKVELALATGRTYEDKRQALKEADAKRRMKAAASPKVKHRR